MLQRVHAAQDTARRATWEATCDMARKEEHSFCMRDGLVCRKLQGNDVSIVVPGDEALRQ